METKNSMKTLIVFAMILVAMVSFALAATVPQGPETLTHSAEDGRKLPTWFKADSAFAGNITYLTVTGSSITQTWQGYVGNITGVILLQDSSNNTLYNWSQAQPSGLILATYLTAVEWENAGNAITCWNWSNPTETYLQLAEYGGWDDSFGTGPQNVSTPTLGLVSTDVDGINYTFSCGSTCSEPEVDAGIQTNNTHSNFVIGSALIRGDRFDGQSNITGPCPSLKLFAKNTNATDSFTKEVFEEVLLYNDNTFGNGSDADGIIYASILKKYNTIGFDGRNWDFEMIVGEDGHNGDTSTTTYYFYVMLN